MPLFGGVIGIGIGQGLHYYEAGAAILGIEASKYDLSKRSFMTVKIDNVDMARLHLRLLDPQGNPASKGRVEMRLNGVWGTVCNK